MKTESFKTFLFLITLLGFLSSCSPKINMNLSEAMPQKTLDPNEKVFVFELDEELPEASVFIGEIEIGDLLGMTSNCKQDNVRSFAVNQCRKVGANILKIKKEKHPGFFSDCYSMEADMYSLDKRAIHQPEEAEIADYLRNTFNRKQDVLIIEQYAKDSISIHDSLLVKKLKLTHGWRHKSYEDFRLKAVDSTQTQEGNILKIVLFQEAPSNNAGFSMKENKMEIEIYKVDATTYKELEQKIETQNLKQSIWLENRSWGAKVFGDDKYSAPTPDEDRFFFTQHRDSTSAHRFELGVYAGMDILAALNLHINTEFHLINSRYSKISLSNKAGGMMVAAGYSLAYTAPGIKLAVPIKNHWLTLTYGKEFIQYYNGSGERDGTSVIDTRIDIGLKMYKNNNTSMEIYYPLRLDKEVIDWWTGGIVLGINKRF